MKIFTFYLYFDFTNPTNVGICQLTISNTCIIAPAPSYKQFPNLRSVLEEDSRNEALNTLKQIEDQKRQNVYILFLNTNVSKE